MTGTARLIAIEGTNGAALGAAARAMAAEHRDQRPCVSVWDASAIFQEVQLATVGAGAPSARTLLLLYAADLAYRLRAEIRPALDAGRLVIAAPYVSTAVALAHAAGLDDAWSTEVLAFAPSPSKRELSDAAPADAADRRGFVEFCCSQLLRDDDEAGRLDLIKKTTARLKK